MDHQSQLIKDVISQFFTPEYIKTIWEIGSRDRQDAIEMGGVFQSADITCFEPNPDTYSLVNEVAASSGGNIQARNLALSDTDGEITFFKIDREQTKTTWLDGNPGASSMFLANGEYEIEEYVQTPVTVMSTRGDSFIDSGDVTTPNLIWMDVQGAERLVLEGFGSYLRDVDVIYVELSLRSIYTGQSLAPEVVNYLRRDFFWHSNLSFGAWQFDALFINKKHANLLLRIRSQILSSFLRRGIGLGIKYPIPTVKQVVLRLCSFPWKILASVVRKTDSRLIGGIFRKFAIMAAKICRNGVIPAGLRKVLSLAQPIDPLKEGSIPAIDIVIPCHHKDFDLLYLTVEAARKCVLNPIGEVKLITNPDFVIELKERFPDCQILSETDFLTAEIMEKIEDSVPLERRGWVIQQVVKFNASLEGSEQASLVLDADTILTRPRVWLDSHEVQILCISEEYHTPYFNHYELVFGDALFPWSFVTHHQLMQKNVLKSMFGEDKNSLIPWLDKADFTSSSALCEYHTYGHWLTSNRPELVSYAKWNNTAKKIDLASLSGYSDFAFDHSKYFSVSCHSYL